MNITILMFSLFTFCNLSASLPDENDKVNKIIETVTDNLSAFLSKIPTGQENYFGFSNREEFQLCNVGKPYQVITFTNDYYTEENLTDKNYIFVQNEWRVPILVNGENRLLFTVNQIDTTFQVVDIGAASLAKDLQQKDSYVSSDNRYLLRIYPLKLDFLVKVPQNSSFTDAIFIPLTSATTSIKFLDSKSKSYYILTDVLQIIKQQMNEQIKTK